MFKLTPLWQIQKKQENDMLRAALGPVVGNAVIKVHEDNLRSARGGSGSSNYDEENEKGKCELTEEASKYLDSLGWWNPHPYRG
jgi:hypothetical protein